MSIVDNIRARFSRRRDNNLRWQQLLNGTLPIVNQWGNAVYMSDVVQACISAIADEMKKLQPHHLIMGETGPVILDDQIEWVLRQPNSRMTTADFIEYIVWQLFLNYNAFVVPYYDDNGRLIALYPLQQGTYELMKDPSDGEEYLVCQFNSGETLTFIYRNVIHLRKQYGMNEWLGGNINGQPDTANILRLNQINSSILDSVDRGANSSVNGFLKANTKLSQEKALKLLNDMAELIKQNKTGFGLLDADTTFQEITKNRQLVDADTLKFLDSKITRIFGVSLAILSGDFTKSQYEAFYQKALEPLCISFSQAFTKALCSEREIRGYGHQIRFYAKELIFMTNEEKARMIELFKETGTLYENEKRGVYGFLPLKELDGKRLMSLNYVNADIADEYQMNRVKSTNRTYTLTPVDDSPASGDNE